MPSPLRWPGVIHQATVFADGLAVNADDRARLRRQVAAEEVTELALADKADAGGVFLLGGDQLQLLGDAAHLRLLQLPDREQALRHLLVAQGVEEVALIFVTVDAAQQAALAVHVPAAHVVAGGDKIGPQIFGGKLREGFEFDLFIAQDVRVRRAAGLVLFRNSSNTLSQYSAAKFTVCSSMPSLSQTACASARSVAAEQYSSSSSSSQFFMNSPAT